MQERYENVSILGLSICSLIQFHKLARFLFFSPQIFFDGISKLVCTYNSDFDRHVKENIAKEVTNERLDISEKELSDIVSNIDLIESRHSSRQCNGDVGGDAAKSMLDNMDMPVADICFIIRNYITNKNVEKKAQSRRHAIEAEWRYLALILDRVFMVVYLTVVIVSVILLFPR